MSGNDGRKMLHGVSPQSALRLTSEDGLVDTQGGGLDGNDPDVSGDFVTNWGRHKEADIKINARDVSLNPPQKKRNNHDQFSNMQTTHSIL